jgi:hypothetical protein
MMRNSSNFPTRPLVSSIPDRPAAVHAAVPLPRRPALREPTAYASGKTRWNQVGGVLPKQVRTLLMQASRRYVSIIARIGTLE